MMAQSNGTNLTDDVDYDCPLVSAVGIVNSYAIPVISGLGVLTNTLCIAVFARILFSEPTPGHMFKYLLCKAVHDDVQFICQVFAPLYYCTSCSTYRSYSAQVWYVWFYYYVESVNEWCSGFFEVAATFDCLITINRRLRFCQRNLCFALVLVASLAFSLLYYSYVLFRFEIKQVPSANETAAEFVYEYTEFESTTLNMVLKTLHGVMRDVLMLLLVLALNVLIMLTIRRRMAQKRVMTSTPAKSAAAVSVNGTAALAPADSTRKHSTQLTRTRAQRSELNVMKMVVSTGVNYCVGHLTSFIFYCVLIYYPSKFRSCLFVFGELLFYSSYVTPFVIYYIFNSSFRSHLHQMPSWALGRALHRIDRRHS